MENNLHRAKEPAPVNSELMCHLTQQEIWHLSNGTTYKKEPQNNYWNSYYTFQDTKKNSSVFPSTLGPTLTLPSSYR